MNILKLDRLVNKLMVSWDNGRHITLFNKALYFFLLLKVLALWSLFGDILSYKPFTYNSTLSYFLFAPLVLAKFHVPLFLTLFIVILIVGISTRINYFLAFIICWFSISLSRLSLPVINGSDLVLNLFLIIAIFLPKYPKHKFKNGEQLQTIISNTALLFAQIQFAMIYFLSGYDKLISASWRSGAAIDSINNLTYFHNPFITLALNEVACLVLSWSVILFELCFPFLIWLKSFKAPLLLIGIFFHLVIAIALGLIDFAIVMVIGYGVYLPFKKENQNYSASMLPA